MDFMKLCKCKETSDNSLDYPLLKALLPNEYSYRICNYLSGDEGLFETRFRVSCRNEKDVKEWMPKFESVSFTTFRAAKTFPREAKQYVFKLALRCHHNTLPRSHSTKKPHSKNTDCPAIMRITVKTTEKSRKYKSIDKHLQEFPTVVILHHYHNHNILNAEALKHRKPTEEVKEKFLKMFEAGHTPSGAINSHKDDLLRIYEDEYYIVAADRGQCQDMQWVYNLYYNVFQQNYGRSSGEGMLQSLESFVASYNTKCGDKCANFQTTGDNFFVSIMSPFMKRVLKGMPTCGEIIFIDSSGNCDRFGCRVFLLMTNTCAGFFPVGTILTTPEKREVVSAALSSYKMMCEEDMFKRRGPNGPFMFMSDDSATERRAIADAFPDAILLLCIFHVLSTAWSYLWNSSTGIHSEDRQELFFLVKDMLYTDSEENLHKEFDILQNSSTAQTYPKFVSYAQQLYERREDWALCYRMRLPFCGQNTNDLCEASMCVLKEKVLLRTKAYNVVQLFDFLLNDLNSFYVKKAIDAANGQPPACKMKRNSQDCLDYLTVRKASNNFFEVLNKKNEQCYCVDMETGFCTCLIGQSGAICKHQNHIAISQRKQLPLALPVSEAAKKKSAFCGFGKH